MIDKDQFACRILRSQIESQKITNDKSNIYTVESLPSKNARNTI